MSEDLAHPDLYTGRRSGTVHLLATRCRVCGYVAFPRQRYGCEKCGATADALDDVELGADGTLASYATVFMHQAKTIAAPFVIGEVKLDSGPTVRATMVEAVDDAMRVGARVVGTLFQASLSDETLAAKLELRFTLAVQP